MDATTCTPFGTRCRISSTDPRIVAGMEPALIGFPDLGLGDELHLDVEWVDDGPDDPAWPHTTTRWDGRHLELHCGSARLMADAATGRATITLPPSLAAEPDAVRMLLEGALSALLIGRGRLHAVHAALVGDGRRAVLLRGQSGAGKSTLTYACWRAGLLIGSDDWSYHVAGTPSRHFVGYPWRMFLMPDTPRWFAELEGLAPIAHPSLDRAKLPITIDPAHQLVQSAVDAVVFLTPEGPEGPVEVDGAEALHRFGASALDTERSDLPASFREALATLPSFTLARGASPQATALHVQRLLAEL